MNISLKQKLTFFLFRKRIFRFEIILLASGPFMVSRRDPIDLTISLKKMVLVLFDFPDV